MTFDLKNGDCLHLLKKIPDKSVSMILADLPFGTTKAHWDHPVPLDKLWKQYERIIKDNGVIALWAQSPFDKTLACSNMKLYRYEWIIQKTRPTGFLNAKKMPMKAHENVLIFYKSLPTYHPQMTHGHERKVSTAYQKRNSKKTECYGDYGLTTYDSTDRYPLDVLKFKWDTQTSKGHSAQKPVAACEYFIRTYTDPGDTVLDNVMGYGSTAIAAYNTGRNFIGMELDKEIFNSALLRISIQTGKTIKELTGEVQKSEREIAGSKGAGEAVLDMRQV